MLTSMMSVALTPGGSGPPPKKTEAGAENTVPEQCTVGWLGWALPPPTADDETFRITCFVASVVVVVNATGMPWPACPTICPAPLLSCMLGATETVTGPSCSQVRLMICLPGAAGPEATAAPVNAAAAATIEATPISSARGI